MNNITSFIPNKYKKPLFVFLGISFISIILLWMQQKPVKKEEVAVNISENIPEGFVMVPIDLENHESLSEVIHSHGVVDLYQKSSRQSLKAAQAVRVIRLKPSRFAALIPEERTSSFLSSSLEFYAVVQNINKQGSIIYDKRRKRSIVIEKESSSDEM